MSQVITNAVRPVTPYQCPKCHALWLHWPKEQTGWDTDTLNLRSEKSCDHCEPGGIERLERLERVPPTDGKLAAIARKFIDDHRVSCVEATANDRVYEHAPELVEQLAEVVGYYKHPEDRA